MKAEDREVAGLWCHQVLADLAAYVDGELAPERVVQIEQHLQGCTVCERFGGEYAATVKAVKQTLGPSANDDQGDAAEDAAMARLEARLAELG